MRILTIISGILMVLSGVFCFVNPGQTFLALAFIIGIVMVINGIIHTMAYLIGRGFHNRGTRDLVLLTDALITLLLGILVLCNQLVADTVIPMVFGMWILVSGILRIEAATRIDRVRKRANFMTTLLTGILTVIIGIFGFINPLVMLLSTTVLLGIFLVMEGVNIIELGIHMPHEKKSYVKIYKRRREPVKITPEDETPEKVAERIEAKKRAEEEEAIGINNINGNV